MKNGMYKFKRKNLVSCVGVPIGKLIWNYICWLLAGKPETDERKV